MALTTFNHAIDTTAAEIEKLRKQRQPTPVKFQVPNWLAVPVRRAFGIKAPMSNRAVLEEAGQEEWLDHVGTTEIDGCKCFVSEPYDDERIPSRQKALKEFCDKTGFRFTVTKDSWHYPGRTVRFIIWQP